MATATILAALALLTPAAGTSAQPASDTGSGTRLAIIGIDGADIDVMRPLLASGTLPHLQRLIDAGTMTYLNSHPPTRSPAVWTTIATGVRKETHGIYDYVTNTYYWPKELRTKAKNTTTTAMRRVPALWNILTQHQRSTVVVGWLSSWPAEEIQGAVVAPFIDIGNRRQTTIKGSIYKWRAPRQTHDPRLLRELRPLLREPWAYGPRSRMQYYDELPAGSSVYQRIPILRRYNYTASWSSARMHNVTQATLYLQRKLQPELVMAYYQCPDSFGHRFWHFRLNESELADRLELMGVDRTETADLKRRYGQAIDNCYRAVDKEVGKLLDALGPEVSIMVVSDHGFGGNQFSKVNRSVPFDGGHRPQGTIILAGPGFKPGAALDQPWCEDVAPTALHLLGLQLPAHIEGRVLTEGLAAASTTQGFVAPPPRASREARPAPAKSHGSSTGSSAAAPAR